MVEIHIDRMTCLTLAPAGTYFLIFILLMKPLPLEYFTSVQLLNALCCVLNSARTEYFIRDVFSGVF